MYSPIYIHTPIYFTCAHTSASTYTCTHAHTHTLTQARNLCRHTVTADGFYRRTVTMRLGVHTDEFWNSETRQYWEEPDTDAPAPV